MLKDQNNGKKLLFLHIPKCAGVSLAEALEKKTSVRRQGPHCKYGEIFLSKGGLAREDYFVFTFIRNPWDRLVSTFFYILKGGRAEIDIRRRDLYLRKYRGDFRSFVLDIENWIDIKESDSIYHDQFIPHFRPQNEFICDNSGNVLVDFVGRVETIDTDFQSLCKTLSIDTVPLPKNNRSSHFSYHKYYDDETRAIVAKYYAKDIELFSFTFQSDKFSFRDLFHFCRE